MSYSVQFTHDAAEVLESSAEFLARNPVENSLVFTALYGAAARGEVGMFWTVGNETSVVGVVVVSAPDRPVAITHVPADAIPALIECIQRDAGSLRGVTGGVATAAVFAGEYAAALRAPVTPVSGMRLYQLVDLQPGAEVVGSARVADESDVPLVADWLERFDAEINEISGSRLQVAKERIAAQRVYLWDVNGEPVSLVSHHQPIRHVVRIAPVFTPQKQRGRGYAAACVGHLSRLLRDQGNTCILYADLDNPTSNGVYHRLGYRPLSEAITYHFGPGV